MKPFDIQPSEAIFNEIKEKSIAIWSLYDDTHWYATEKMNRVKGFKNIGDNALYIVNMFDYPNQKKLLSKVSEETRQYILSFQ